MAKQPVGPVKATGKIAPKPPKKDPETARETKKLPPPKANPLKVTKTSDKADVLAAKIAAGKVVGRKPFKFVGFDPSSIKIKKPGPKKPPSDRGPGPITPVTSNPVETVVPTSGLVDGVNYKDLYLKEISRLVLSLVHNAKSLLIRYNFSGIDRVPEYYLDSDRESKSQAVASTTSRPQSPFSLTEANLQDQFSTDINEINNKISDLTDNSVRSEYFGTMRGGTFLPREVKIFADGRTGYDMRLTFTSVSNQDFIIKCYEVS